jgi:hypothetical protein
MLACHSRGPVGISDGPGQTDSDLVRRIITHRGTILQPSRAMMAIDASYAKNKSRRPDGEVWASRTVLPLTGVSGHEFCTTHFVLAVGNEDSTGKGYTLRRGDLQLDARTPYLVRRWTPDPANGCTEKAAAANCATTWLARSGAPHLSLPAQNQSDGSVWNNASAPFAHELWGIYPVLGNGFALLGELDKFVGVSETRFGAVTVDANVMVVELRGDPGEVVTVTAAVPKSRKVVAGGWGATGCSSGAWEHNTNFGGHDLLSYAGVKSASACCANCSSTNGCSAWTWAGASPDAGPPFYCWLKTLAANHSSLGGRISGVLGPPPPPPSPANQKKRYSCAAGLCTAVPGGGAFNTSTCDGQCKVGPPPQPRGIGLLLRVMSVVVPSNGSTFVSFGKV